LAVLRPATGSAAAARERGKVLRRGVIEGFIHQFGGLEQGAKRETSGQDDREFHDLGLLESGWISEAAPEQGGQAQRAEQGDRRLLDATIYNMFRKPRVSVADAPSTARYRDSPSASVTVETT
jgi:hypothetical protein